MPDVCDVAVIGAGVGGLTAAALLSHAGLDVAVFEANAVPGGYLSTFTRKGFVFDPAVQWLNQCHPSGFIYSIFGLLGGDFPRCQPLQRIARYKGNTFDYLLTTAPGALAAHLIDDFPQDARGIRALFRDAEHVGRYWANLSSRIRVSETMSFREKLRHGQFMMANSLPLLKHGTGSIERKLRGYFRTPEARRLFCRERNLLSVLVPIGWAYSGDFQAPPVGGSHAMITWLCRRLEASSGHLYLNRRVTRVLLDGKRASGVELEGGRRVKTRHVLAAGDLLNLYENLLPPEATSRNLRKALRNADLYASSFCVFLGLDCDPAQLGFGEELLYLMCEDVPRAEQSLDDPTRIALTIIAPSVRDASLAPPGKGTLIIQCPASIEAHEMWRTGSDGCRGEAYRELKEQVADVLIDRLERCAVPGLRKHIEVINIATPMTYRRYTGNLHGSIMGTKPTAHNIRARLAGYRTPVDGLLLSGHWAEYGGGVPMAIKAGANAALLVLKDAGSDGYETLKHAIDGCAPK